LKYKTTYKNLSHAKYLWNRYYLFFYHFIKLFHCKERNFKAGCGRWVFIVIAVIAVYFFIITKYSRNNTSAKNQTIL
jgi:hypothetical protein